MFKFLKKCFQFNQLNFRMGFCMLHCWRLCLLIVWGYHGNIYPLGLTIRIGRLPLFGGWGISFNTRHLMETYIGFRKSWRFIYWHSEHLAYWFGKQVPEGGNHPSYKIYDGILGNHMIFD